MAIKKIVFVLLLIILLPALFYTGYELNSLSTSEKLMTEIYDRQLNSILFSVNQHAWDVVNGWASKINLMISESQYKGDTGLENSIRDFLQSTRAIDAVFLSDSLLQESRLIMPQNNKRALNDASRLVQKSLESQSPLIKKLYQLRRSGYRKIQPVTSNESQQDVLLLIFATESFGENAQLAGMLLNIKNFIREVLAPKLDEVSGEEFILGIFQEDSQTPVLATSELRLDEIVQQKQVWLFPNHVLGIRLKGATIQEFARQRFYRSLILIILLDAVLLVGAWIIYRNVKREMELARLKSDFVSNVSHELKTPLALIRMFAETLDMDRLRSEDKKRAYYRVISQETERLTHLVNNILNFSRMEEGRKHYEFKRVNLNAIVGQVLDRYQFHLNESGFKLSLRLAEAIPDIEADEESVAEAFINLLDNAIKYSRDEKTITIVTGQENGAVYLDVEDRGVGISPEEQERIFEKFYRVASGLVHDTKGSGLGLTLVKHIMEAHGGRISVVSEIGKGSRFRLSFHGVKSE